MNSSQDVFEPPTCPVCIEALTADLAVTCCGHVFHSPWYDLASIYRAIAIKPLCPNCRGTVNVTDVFGAVFTLTKVKAHWEELNLSEEEAANAEKLLEKLAEVTRTKEKLESQTAEYSKRLKELTDDLDSIKQVNLDYKRQADESRERADCVLRKLQASEISIQRLGELLGQEEKIRKALQERNKDLERVERIVKTGREGAEGEALDTIRRTRGAADQANEFYSYCLLLNSRLREQTRETERLRTQFQRLEASETSLKVEIQYLKRSRDLLKGPFTGENMKRPQAEGKTSPELLEMPKKPKLQPSFLSRGK